MANNEQQKRFEAAVRTNDNSKALFQLASQLRDEGLSQKEVYSLFQSFRDKVSDSEDEATYNSILDTMDAIYGGPWAKGRSIFPQEMKTD